MPGKIYSRPTTFDSPTANTKITTKLTEIKLANLKTTDLYHFWSNLNNNYKSFEPSKHGLACDDPRLLMKAKNTKLTFRTSYYCVTNLFLEALNCSSNSCAKYLTQSFIYPPLLTLADLAMTLGQNRYLHSRPLEYGIRQEGFKFEIYYQNKKSANLDIFALAKPISGQGWLSIAFVFPMITFALKVTGLPQPIFQTVSAILEQDNYNGKQSIKVSALFVIWSFTCLLLRNVYTSSMFTYLTAGSVPVFPSTIYELIFNSTLGIVSTNDGQTMIFRRNPSVKYGMPYLTERTLDSVLGNNTCRIAGTTRFDSDKPRIQLIQNLSMFKDIKCETHEPLILEDKTIEVSPNSKFQTFGLIHKTTDYTYPLYSVFTNRKAYENVNEIIPAIHVVTTKLRHSLEPSLVKYLATMDSNGYGTKKDFSDEAGTPVPFRVEDATLIFLIWCSILFLSCFVFANEVVDDKINGRQLLRFWI
ncbi:unnamed protein product [Orchesella dallaii]|uniref:Uncharacterized protein n=1 Tax=Orchesella dallaii TaxID=48710 RepID=A0ABP1QFT6_9HEXA